MPFGLSLEELSSLIGESSQGYYGKTCTLDCLAIRRCRAFGRLGAHYDMGADCVGLISHLSRRLRQLVLPTPTKGACSLCPAAAARLAVAAVSPQLRCRCSVAAMTWALLARKPTFTTVVWSVEKDPAVPPRKPQKACTRCLGGLVARVPIHCLGSEWRGGGDRSLAVRVGDLAE